MNTFYYLLAIIPSIILHEISHGFVANLCGDPTAKNAHRLTLNPLRHIDPFGTILLPFLLIATGLPAFGWAKPVPVNVGRLRKPRSQSLYVSLAGPLTNIILSAIAFFFVRYELHSTSNFVSNSSFFTFMVYFGLVNLILAVFNLLPIPPLDGSAIIERFVPVRHLPRYYQMRARALPFVMGALILNALTLHIGTTWLASLQQHWLTLVQN
ncbi:MAG: site-2 protease family protein [Acidimicrobiaceae bacterium]|nr:site-2 protease family protein [Acidimicrobiaceae bacterium]